jgi:hypothetical protein
MTRRTNVRLSIRTLLHWVSNVRIRQIFLFLHRRQIWMKHVNRLENDGGSSSETSVSVYHAADAVDWRTCAPIPLAHRTCSFSFYVLITFYFCPDVSWYWSLWRLMFVFIHFWPSFYFLLLNVLFLFSSCMISCSCLYVWPIVSLLLLLFSLVQCFMYFAWGQVNGKIPSGS